MSRRRVIAANWKMNGTRREASSLATGVRDGLSGFDLADVVLCPPFTALETVAASIRDSPLHLGAQNVYWKESGAFTGEIAPAMLSDLGCRFVILGHSERRTLFDETDATVHRRIEAALGGGLVPIVCVGETLEEREAGATERVLARQVREGLRDFGEELEKIVVAYEPVWAIGTGVTASVEQAQSAHRFIRGTIAELAGETVASGLRILYGGSVKPGNAGELCAQPDVDGGLVGGASLDARSFVAIVRAAAEA